MRKIIAFILAAAVAALALPATALAASASFSISGPATLRNGQTGTYKINITVNDAAGAQAELIIDKSFFEIVSGNVKGTWDESENKTGTFSLNNTVTLKCIAEEGTTGNLTLTGCKVTRFGDLGIEYVSCSGASLTVANPVVTPSPTPSPTPKPTPRPTPKPTPVPTVSPGPTPPPSPTPVRSASPTARPSAGPAASPAPSPAASGDPWIRILDEIRDTTPRSTVRFETESHALVPPSVLERIREKQAVLVIEGNGYACAIDGSGVGELPADLEPIDVSPDMERDAALSAAAGGRDDYQLRFSGGGELPVRVTYRLKATGHHPGDVLHLYYYYQQTGVIEWRQASAVDAEGYVSFAIYHFSSYFISDELIPGAVNLPALARTPGRDSVVIPLWLLAALLYAAAKLCATVTALTLWRGRKTARSV